MKRWALLVVGLYALCISIFAAPILLFLAPGEVKRPDLLAFFYVWIAPVLVLVQALLLLLPIAVVRERPVKRRAILASAVVGAIPMAVMGIAFLGSSVLMMVGEKNAAPSLNWPTFLSIIVGLWSVWGVIFWRSFVNGDPASMTSTITRWLLRGSILELLVAIPSHIISRHRDECCAPPLSLLGIVTGLAVGFMSFGPGLFFVFAEKIRTKKGVNRSCVY